MKGQNLDTLRERWTKRTKSDNFQILRTFYENSIDTLRETNAGKPLPTGPDRELLEKLNRDGQLRIDFIPHEEAVKLREWLSELPVRDGHSPAITKGNEYKTYREVTGENYSHYSTEQLLSSPIMRKYWVENSRLEAFARGYLEAEPVLYGLGCFWSYPNTEPHPYSQMWHRDWDDLRFLAHFTFLTDVDDAAGGRHKFIRGSHKPEIPQELQRMGRFSRTIHKALSYGLAVWQGKKRIQGYCGTEKANMNAAEYFGGYKLHPYYAKFLRKRVLVVQGRTGTGFLEDPGGLHVGEVPKHEPRLIMWARFGVTVTPMGTARQPSAGGQGS